MRRHGALCSLRLIYIIAVSWAVPNKSELLLLIGRPKSGKTHYFTTHLKPLGYDLVSTPLQIPSIGKMLRDGKSVALGAFASISRVVPLLNEDDLQIRIIAL